MICANCGKINVDGSKFCTGCGSALPQGPGQPPQVEGTVPASTQASGYGVNYEKGCASQSWQDIRNSGHWASRSFMAGLVSMIPILNFSTTGYFYGLGKHAARGNKDTLPSSVVTGENFKRGFFIWLITLIVSVVFAFIGIPFTIFAAMQPPVGYLLLIPYLVVCFFAIFFIRLMLMRYTLLGFDETFKLGKIWKAYKRQFGKLFCLEVLPTLIIGLIELAIMFVFAGIIYWIVSSTGMAVYKYGTWRFSAVATELVVVCVFVGIIGSYFLSVVNCVKEMIVVRAYGIYIARYVPEWAQESARKESFSESEGYVQDQAAVNPAAPPATGILVNPYDSESYGNNDNNVTNQSAPESNAAAVPTATAVPQPGSDKGTSVLGDVRITLVATDGKEYSIDNFPAVIGKGSAANCIIEGDESISRAHAKIHEYGQNGFVIEDQHSTNKTYLNGNVLEPEELVLLSDGDKLKIGKSSFVVRFN